MKKNARLLMVIMISVFMSKNTKSQTLDNVQKSDGAGGLVNTITPIFEDVTNVRIGIGTNTPSNKLTVSGNSNITGNLGIGVTTPSHRLDVSGNINLPLSNAYYINGNRFTGTSNTLNNLYLGFGTGASGLYNVFLGHNSGAAEIGLANTYVGYDAAASAGASGNSYNNTAVGFQSLKVTQAYGGCAYGFKSAFSNNAGCSIVAIGEEALYNNYDGNDNTGIGHDAGYSMTDGNNCTFLGSHADAASGTLDNAAAIGVGAIVNNSNEMVLGDNTVYIGIGYSNVATFPPGKLSVDENAGDVLTETIAGFFHNGDVTGDAQSSSVKRGIYSISDGVFSQREGYWIANIAGDFEAYNSEVDNIAVRGLTGIAPDAPENSNFGGWFEGNHAESYNIGVYASAYGDAAVNYGIYAIAPKNTCGNGGTCYDAAGFFNGDVYTTDNYYMSDAILKTNVQPLQNGLDIVKLLQPKTYTYRTTQFPYLSLPSSPQDGLIAQDVQSVLPELVSNFKLPARRDSTGATDTTGTGSSFLAVNYVKIIPYLISAIQEQDVKIANLQDQLDNCCSIGQILRKTQNVDLANVTEIILNQNSPNPFSEETYINYSLPESVSKAMIIIYDHVGTVIKRVTLEERGEGSIHIFAEKLSAGIYSYSLVADGKTIDTKQMVCSK